MMELAGKIAVVTGAASGIGLGVARALSQAGMRIALLDIQRDALDRARRQLSGGGAQVLAAVVDVSSPESMANAAAKVEGELGAPHVLVNNAGVAFHGTPLQSTTYEDWQWLLNVNVMGAINGVRAFLPLMQRHGEGSHIVNTASGSGFFIRPGRHQGPYAVTKYALVAFSEALEQELTGTNIGVSVLCPGAVNTSLHLSAKHRPEQFGGPGDRPNEQFLEDLMTQGLSIDEVGAMVVQAIRHDKFYIFTHASTRAPIEARHARILAAFE
jgi:NAD(P)-dependent dehydrogenase (short-subunit alcohol dehydrogenase family)